MSKWRIDCSLDGKESESKLYGKYEDLATRTFPNNRYRMEIEDYLNTRAMRIQWEFERPTYRLVQIDE
jgi:hypothetical protein